MIYGSFIYDISVIAHCLDSIGYSYKLIGKEVGQYIERTNKVKTDILVVESVERARKLNADTIIIIDSKPMLARTNVDPLLFPVMNERSLIARLKKVINNPHLDLTVKEDSLQEVIDKLTTKSVLTDVQTLVNKINPYDLRKKVHKAVISYLYGSSTKDLEHFLSSSPKLRPLLEVCKSKAIKTIRQAVGEYKKIKDEEKVSKQFGVHTFEILYVFNSYKKLEAENADK